MTEQPECEEDEEDDDDDMNLDVDMYNEPMVRSKYTTLYCHFLYLQSVVTLRCFLLYLFVLSRCLTALKVAFSVCFM